MGGKWREFVKTYCGEANLVQLFTTRTKWRLRGGEYAFPIRFQNQAPAIPRCSSFRNWAAQR